MKRVVAVIIVVLAVVAYVAGYWPEYQRRVALEGEAVSLRAERDDLEARVRGARLLGSLLTVTEAVGAMNFGQAQTLSSAFFDDVRAEEARATGDMQATLAAIQQNRDAVTSALARGDATVIMTLRSMQIQLREALGYPVPPPGSTPSPVAPPQPIVPDRPNLPAPQGTPAPDTAAPPAPPTPGTP